MLVSVRCPHCHTAYPPRQMHTCRPPSIQMRVKPIYDRNTGDLTTPESRSEPVKPKTLSFGAASVPAPSPKAASPEGRRRAQVRRAANPEAAAQSSPGPIMVNGVELDAETIATALKLLVKRREQQQRYQKKRRAAK